MDSTRSSRWYFTREQLENSPSRRCGVDAERELSLRQQSANFIQDMGQRLQVSQLCINTGIVYMHRFYCFHSFTQFSRTNMAAASIFLAAKVEEQPRKLEHIIKVKLMCLSKNNVTLDRHSELYMQQAQELVMNENILLMTLGFDVAIEHPHAFIVKFCHIANASKDLSQTSYFMASNSLHLTTMCLQYKPTVVACVCIHLSCQWSRWQIPKSKENLPWYTYIDQTVTEELLEQLTNEFLAVFDKCPSRLLKKKQVGQNGQQNAMTVQDGPHQYHQPLQPASSSSYYSSSSSSAKPIASSSSSSSSAPAPVVNGSKSHQSSASLLGDTATHKLPKSSSSVMPPQHVKPGSSHSVPPHSSRPPPPSSSSSSSQQQQQHVPKPLHPYGVPASSAMKPYPPLTGPSNIGSKHPTDSTAQYVFMRDASGQRMEQKPSSAADVKHKPGPSSAPPSSQAVNNHHQANRLSNVFAENPYRKENTPLPLIPLANPIPASRTASFTSTSDHDIIQHVVKEVASKQEEKQRLSSTLKIEPKTEPFDAVPSTSYQCMSTSSARNPSIFSPPYFPSPTFGNLEDSVKTSPPMSKVIVEKSPDLEDPRLRKRSSSSGEQELTLIKKESTEFEEFDTISPKGESRDGESSANDMSHSHKKKKKHKEKDKKHDKEKHRHKEKKRHKEDKYKKEHKEKRPSKEHDGASTSDAVPERNPGSSIKITIPKEKLKDIPKLKISLNNQVVTPSVSDSEENVRLKISKDKIKSSRKRHRDSSDSAGPSKKHNGSGSHNGY